ncbi:choice-of-anchor J domain-containing protein [Roseateles chitinivorans]|uniref:choice-of-anchor J domain-containing protein n=1 Tax=Roseateles chitinivorans TaxID=2917965 RepID=UPI003D66AFA9
MFKKTCLALALVGAAAAAHAGPTLINEGFDDVASLAAKGWKIENHGSPAGAIEPWYQGNVSTGFTDLHGDPTAYVAAQYGAVAAGGILSSWLISPVFSTAENLEVSFWARGDGTPGYIDQLAYGLLDVSGAFTSFIPQAAITVVGEWTRYSFQLAGQGAGSSARFAIQYFGNGDEANVVGVDDVAINVPEPSTWALAGVSLLGLVAARRRRTQA